MCRDRTGMARHGGKTDQHNAIGARKFTVLKALNDVHWAPGEIFDGDIRKIFECRFKFDHQVRAERVRFDNRRVPDDPNYDTRLIHAPDQSIPQAQVVTSRVTT